MRTIRLAALQDRQARYGHIRFRAARLARFPEPFLLRSDNDLVFSSRSYTQLGRSCDLRQESLTPHCPQQNGTVERLIRTLKERLVHCHRFESAQHLSRIIADWILFYNTQRPRQVQKMKTPAEAYALAVQLEQKGLGHYIYAPLTMFVVLNIARMNLYPTVWLTLCWHYF